MATFILDGLNLNNATSYSVAVDPDFGDPKNRAQIQNYIDEHGGEVIKGSDNYDVIEHKIKVYVLGNSSETNNATLYANLSALQQKVLKKNVVFEFKFDGATNSNYADVLFTTVGGGFSFASWKQFIDNDKILVELILTCKPFWRGEQVTIGPLYYSKSPAIILPGTVKGDVETSAVTTLSTQEFGLIQQASDTSLIDTTPTVTLSSAATAGNLIVIGIGIDKDATSITAPSGFTIIQSYTSANVSGAMAYKIATGGETAITWTLGGIGAAGCTVWAGEYRGTLSSSVLDVSAENNSGVATVSTLATGTTGATAQNDELAIAMMMIDSVAAETYSWDNSFSNVYTGSATDGVGGLFVASKTLTATGTQTSTCTWTTADQAYACIATFKLNAPAISTKAFGNKLVVGSRSGEKAIAEGNFNPIKDFQGSTGTGFYNGQYARTACSSAWTNLTGESRNINSISQINANVGFAACDGGIILKTTNGGATITRKSSSATGTSINLNGISAPTSNVIFACGDYGKITHSTNGGATWILQTLGVNHHNTVFFINSSIGWIGGDYSYLRKTINRGSSWNTTLVSTGVYHNESIYFINSSIGWIIASNRGNILKSTNGGATWTPHSAGGLGYRGLSFVNSNIGWIVGNYGGYGQVRRTTDGGISWILQSTDNIDSYNNISFTSTNTGWLVGSNGKILATTNSGSSWHQQISNISNNLNGISAVNSTVVFSGGNGYSLLKTTDGGDNWSKVLDGWALGNSSNYQDTYRCFARTRNNSTNPDGVQMRASAGWAGGSVIASSAVSLANTTKQQWVDLGNISIPAVPLSSGVSATPIVKLEAKNGSTKSINFDTDVAVLVPQSGQVHYNSTTATSAQPITLDYDSEAVNKGYTITTYTGDDGIKLNPGTNNNIIALETKTYSTGTDGYNPVNVDISYFPRYLNPISAT